MEIAGYNSGLDVDSIVSQLMSIERRPIANYELKKQLIDKKTDIYNDIKSRIENLKTYASTLTNESTFNVFNATYSKESVISASIGSTASSGSYSITVSMLAKAHTVGSDKQTDDEASLGISGNIKINGKDVVITGTDSLQNIMDNINSTDDIGVTATIVDNVLKIKMSETGSTEITFEDDLSTHALRSLGILDTDDQIKNEFVAASNSEIIIDGQTIEKSTNDINDVIEGVTLTLVKEDTATLTISRNNSSIISNIQNFVNQYNSVVDYVYSQTSERKVISPETDADYYKGLISGDSFLEGIRYELGSLMLNVVNDIDDEYNSLSKIGITKTAFVSNSNNTDLIIGKINIDTAKLTEALNDDPESVKNLFIKNAGVDDLEEGDYGVAARVRQYIDRLTDLSSGFFATKSANFVSETKILEDTITRFNKRMDIREQTLKKQYISLETAMSSSDMQSAWLTAQVNGL